MESVEELCDNIALINKSRVVLHGNVYAIRNAYKQHIFKFRVVADDFDLSDTRFVVLSKQKYPRISRRTATGIIKRRNVGNRKNGDEPLRSGFIRRRIAYDERSVYPNGERNRTRKNNVL